MRNVFVAGHNGMVGSAIVRKLERQGNIRIIMAGRDQLNLLQQQAVLDFFKANQIDEVVVAAAKVGGIHANNTFPADFLYENLMIQCNLIRAAHLFDIQKLLFLGSSCIYPKLAPQPMREEELLCGKLEPTNEPYAIAKIAGIKLCESYRRQFGRDYRSVMPTNLYGPGDNFHAENSHVIPALIRRFHEAASTNAKSITIWGSGSPKREFLHVDDMAAASCHVLDLGEQAYRDGTYEMQSHINVGTGQDCTIRELAETIGKVVGFQGETLFDRSKPDGPPRKLLDVSLINKLGWSASIKLENGLRSTFEWYLENSQVIRQR